MNEVYAQDSNATASTLLYDLHFHTFLAILRIGSTMLRPSTVPFVTLGNNGVNAK